MSSWMGFPSSNLLLYRKVQTDMVWLVSSFLLSLVMSC